MARSPPIPIPSGLHFVPEMFSSRMSVIFEINRDFPYQVALSFDEIAMEVLVGSMIGPSNGTCTSTCRRRRCGTAFAPPRTLLHLSSVSSMPRDGGQSRVCGGLNWLRCTGRSRHQTVGSEYSFALSRKLRALPPASNSSRALNERRVTLGMCGGVIFKYTRVEMVRRPTPSRAVDHATI
jgi:hypothetical protein